MGLHILIFIVALGALLIASKYFTESAERIGLSMNMSPFMVGVIIVAIGTSLPEMIAGIFAMVEGKSEIVIGNIIGANVSNIFLILGITTLISKKSIQLGEEYILVDLHFMLGSAAILVLFLRDGVITFIEGILLLVGFVIYQVYLLRSEKPKAMYTLTNESQKSRRKKLGKDVVKMIAASIGIYFGAKYTISSISLIASSLGISEALISLSVMSVGTTLPELAVSIAAARAGKPQMAVGNILGSCIFNSFAVGGISAIIGPVKIPDEFHVVGMTFMITAAGFFYLLSQDKKVSRFEGMLFILFYVIFILKITNIA